MYSDGYVKLVERAPEFWGMLFEKTDDPKVVRRLNKLKRAFPSKSRARFARHVKQFKPDIVLCTHFCRSKHSGISKQKTACGAILWWSAS